mmetsp:Transcript_29036/g.33171  ORF Transcript_29036/g.33171 Transcript_29036/m.33171 type:complete len:120 (-) Transcript_29036:17-376(-)
MINKILDGTVYSLSQLEGLDWFKTVVFAGSAQDNYSPLESSLVQVSNRIAKHKHYSGIQSICENILKRLSTCKFHRLKVNFKFAEKASLDTFLGRKAHIQFIDNSDLVKTFISMFSDIF